jgi:hypothetical protein
LAQLEVRHLRCVYTIEESAQFIRRVCSSSRLVEQKGRFSRFARREPVHYEPGKLFEPIKLAPLLDSVNAPLL